MTERRRKDAIGEFRGRHRFLSNFHPCGIVLGGEAYPSVEHAYQAAKLSDPEYRDRIRRTIKAGDAKALGHGKGGKSWHKRSLKVMYKLLLQKFAHEPLRSKLLETYPKELVEGNWWGDTFFGVCRGVGENHLGKLLMDVRDVLRKKQEDLERWKDDHT